MQIAADLLDSYSDGVWFVDLSPISDPLSVAPAIATAAGIRGQADKPVLESVKTWVRDKRVLFVLDNCEHMIAECARIVEALAGSCPKLSVLATSREALGLSGEGAYRVPPLASPDPKTLPPLCKLQQYESVQLFLDRARSASSEFHITDQNAHAIACLCSRLDGIPLAIELAAARVKMLSPYQIWRKLDENLHILSGGSRTALPRRQTLEAAIQWSYDLLTGSERRLLERVSVFWGGWTLEAAEGVCAGDGIDEWEILDLLGHLVDKSLVIALNQDTTTRYKLLETVKQFAAAKLLEGDRESLPRPARHLAYFAQLCARWQEINTSCALDYKYELDNLVAAMDFAIADSNEVRALLAVVVYDLSHAAYMTMGATGITESIRCGTAILATCGDQHTPQVAKGYRALSNAYLHVDRRKKLELTERVLEIARHCGETLEIVSDLGDLAGNCAILGDFDAADRYRRRRRIPWLKPPTTRWRRCL